MVLNKNTQINKLTIMGLSLMPKNFERFSVSSQKTPIIKNNKAKFAVKLAAIIPLLPGKIYAKNANKPENILSSMMVCHEIAFGGLKRLT